MDARILLADDHAVVRAGIRNVVNELEGITIVAEVGDGSTLFDELERHRPDCLLIDVAMPDFDPVAAITRVRKEFPEMKILVVSAYDDDVYVQGLLGAGVNGYHLKDQPLSDLQLAVTRVLAGERWISGPLIEKLVTNKRPVVGPVLTPRQQELLRYLWQGLDNQSLAQMTGLSVKTIENHLTRLYRQLDVQSRLEAVNFANQYPEMLGSAGSGPAPAPQQPALAGECETRILVVDDNPRFRQNLHRAIGKVCPAAVIYEAGDISTALYLCSKVNLDLAFVDVVLSSDEDGIRCTRRIHSASPATRIIMISAYPDREFHRLGLEAGAVAFLDKKDLDLATIKQVIEDLA